MEFKICTICIKSKPEEAFYSRFDINKKITIITAQCKSCRSRNYYEAEVWQNNKEILCIECAEPFYGSKSGICKICLISNGRKECSACHEIKDISNFYNKSGRCIECAKSEALAKEEWKKRENLKPSRYLKENEKSIPNHLLNLHRYLKKNYKISVYEYLEISKKCNGLCQICGQESDKRLSVDHCHKTGKIRGLICNKCNIGIGYFKDNPGLLIRAADYLKSND